MSDLIKKTELVSWIDAWFAENRYYHPHSRSEKIPYSELKDILSRMPTVYIGGRVHAMWIDGPSIFDQCCGKAHCSNCGYSVQSIELTNDMVRLTAGKTDYCPQCGARMDGEGGKHDHQ